MNTKETKATNAEEMLLQERDRLYLEGERKKAIDAELAVQRARVEEERLAGLARKLTVTDEEIAATEATARDQVNEIAALFHQIGEAAVRMVATRQRLGGHVVAAVDLERSLGREPRRVTPDRWDLELETAANRASRGFPGLLYRNEVTDGVRTLMIGLGLKL